MDTTYLYVVGQKQLYSEFDILNKKVMDILRTYIWIVDCTVTLSISIIVCKTLHKLLGYVCSTPYLNIYTVTLSLAMKYLKHILQC